MAQTRADLVKNSGALLKSWAGLSGRGRTGVRSSQSGWAGVSSLVIALLLAGTSGAQAAPNQRHGEPRTARSSLVAVDGRARENADQPGAIAQTRQRPQPQRRARGGWLVTRRGAGSRSCGSGELMEAIIPAATPSGLPSGSPSESADIQSPEGFTPEATLEIKVPYAPEELIDLTFLLLDEDFEEIYSLEALEPESGTVVIEIPEEKLQEDAYRWFVEAQINCAPPLSASEGLQPEQSEEEMTIGKQILRGWIERYGSEAERIGS